MSMISIGAPTSRAVAIAASRVSFDENRDGMYMAVVKQAVRFPITAILLTVALLGGIIYSYGKFGAGVEFFPNVEPDYGLLYVHARGNLSLAEMDIARLRARLRD